MAEKQGNDETVDARACVLPHPRVGDAYRELAAEELCGYRADGFLDQDEFEARRDIILSAKTAAEVEAMFTDLHGSLLPRPVTRPAPPAAPPRKAELPVQAQRKSHLIQVWYSTMFLLLGGMIGTGIAKVNWLMVTFIVMFIAGLGFAVIMAVRESIGEDSQEG